MIKKEGEIPGRPYGEVEGIARNQLEERRKEWSLPSPQSRDAVNLDAAQLRDLAREYDVVPAQAWSH